MERETLIDLLYDPRKQTIGLQSIEWLEKTLTTQIEQMDAQTLLRTFLKSDGIQCGVGFRWWWPPNSPDNICQEHLVVYVNQSLYEIVEEKPDFIVPKIYLNYPVKIEYSR